MNLNKYYLKATLYPFLITVIATAVFSIIENRDYKSEWLTGEAITLMMIGLAILYCLLLGVLCLTIFLCRLDIVKRNRIMIFFSWFLLPLIPAVIMAVKIFHGEQDSEQSSIKLFVLLNGPFIIGLVRAFILYRKSEGAF